MGKRKHKQQLEEQALEELKRDFEKLMQQENTMSKLSKLARVNETISVNRYDNGWMVEVSGRDDDSDWKTAKILCNTEEEMIAVIKEWNTMDLDS